MNANLILQPLAIMLLLTCLMAFWALFARVAAMNKNKVAPHKGQDAYQLRQHLPHEVNRIANNYNHLFEQPVLFYALCLGLYLTNSVELLMIICAWSYVGLRVIHSLVQALWDKVMVRFMVFVLSWIPLLALLVLFCLQVF